MQAPTYLSADDHARVTAAVSAAERDTAGEIVTILADRSDGYSDVALAWAALAALLKIFSFAAFPELPGHVITLLTGGWHSEWSTRSILILASIAATAAFVVVWLIQQWDPLKFALIPGIIKTMRVHDRAVRAFRIGTERRTHGRTGILIYLSMRERRAEIVADEAIASQVDPEVWGDAMEAMLAQLKQGRVADGMIAAVERVGAILGDNFPNKRDDMNELPDRLIEV